MRGNFPGSASSTADSRAPSLSSAGRPGMAAWEKVAAKELLPATSTDPALFLRNSRRLGIALLRILVAIRNLGLPCFEGKTAPAIIACQLTLDFGCANRLRAVEFRSIAKNQQAVLTGREPCKSTDRGAAAIVASRPGTTGASCFPNAPPAAPAWWDLS